jgi:hypothetical protein
MTELENVFCGECRTPIKNIGPCVACGSPVRCFHQTVNIEVKSQVSVRLLQKRPEIKKPLVDMFSGRDFRKSVGDFINKLRRIDRAENLYVEHLSTDDGTILKDVVEPLDIHFGHGSDKPELKAAGAAERLKAKGK